MEAAPTFIDFTGNNGLELSISLPRTPLFDYTMMFWIRSAQSYDELKVAESIKNTKAYLFKMKNSVGCYITRFESDDSLVQEGPWLRCELDDLGAVDIELDLADLPDIQSWMHLTYSAQYNQASEKSDVKSFSYLRIDISNFNTQVFGGYGPIKSRRIFYGCGGRSITDFGFAGNYRQYFISLGYLEPENIVYLQHQYKVLDYSTMAYYKFINNIFIDQYEDSFRDQKARAVNILPDFLEETIAAPFCNSIPQKQVLVPQFYRSGGSKFDGIRIPRFKYKGRQIGYTAAFWLKNYGQHAFEPNPARGRESNHIFRLDDSFALWYDSPTSFRVYVFAKDNWEEVYSDPVMLPMHEWINIQVALSQNSGITIMTFNQNGERQQLVQNKLFLGTQYPFGTISLFNSFIGIPYRLAVWDKFIQLPVDMDDQSGLIVSYDFSAFKEPDDVSSFQGWKTLVKDNGEDLPAIKGDGFDLVYDNIPSNVDFRNPSNEGQLTSTTSSWSVTCPAPETSLMYLSGQGAKFDMSILVDQTNTYTIEFWFKADVASFSSVSQDRTFLFQMNGLSEGLSDLQLAKYATNVMAIYVENGELKCAPFGFQNGEPKNPESILTYSGIRPLEEAKWQHISCIYLNQRYVKGQYLAINTGDEGSKNFREEILRPKTFAKSIYQPDPNTEILILNQKDAQRWTIILGNDATFSKQFFGSFKDVRVWKSTRSDAELYSYRFNQADVQEDLEGNLKFMDGNRDVYNTADTNTSGPKYPKNEPNMQLLATDTSNIICATDTYFNPGVRECTRYPYTEQPSIVYLVENNVQHGHQMTLESLFQSNMFLPGDTFQPKTKKKWFVESQVIDQKYFQERSRNIYNLDPIFMGDYNDYKFSIEMNDIVKHNFYLKMTQTVTPRKCLRVVDFASDNAKVRREIKLDGTSQDLEFNFGIKRIEGCSDEYTNKLHKKIVVETQPPIPKSIIDKFETTVADVKQGNFTLKIPSDVLSDPEMPKNIPIDMIFSLFWSSSALENAESYMNIVYTVTLATEIQVKMNYVSKVINMKAGGDLEISASCSSFYNQESEDCNELTSSQGLSFRWECAKEADNTSNALANFCTEWNGSPKIIIPNTLIRNINQINKPTVIKVIVSSIEASEQTTKDATDYLWFDQKNTFTWVDTIQPEFEIDWPQKVKNTVLVSLDQEVSIIPIGWVASDEFSVSFKLINLDSNDEEITLLERGEAWSTKQKILKDTLEYDTNYQFTIRVERVAKSEEDIELNAPVEKDAKFTTLAQPIPPAIRINPQEGEMYDSLFTITLDSENPVGLKYLLYGVINSGDTVEELRLSDSESSLATDNEKQMQLPVVQLIKVVVMNEGGEVASGNSTVTVTKKNTKNWVEILRTRVSDSKAALWQQYYFIAQDANSDARKQANLADEDPSNVDNKEAALTSIADAKNVNEILATKGFVETKITEKETTDEEEEKKIQYIMFTIAKMSAFGDFMVPNEVEGVTTDPLFILQKCVETLEYVLRIESLMVKINSDQNQRTELVIALGQLMDTTSTRAQVSKALKKYDLAGKDKPTLEWTQKNPDAKRRLSSWINEDDQFMPYSPQVLRNLQADEEGTSVGSDNVNVELNGYIDLLRKIIVIKNSLLDQLCGSLTSIDKEIEIKTDDLELYVKRWEADASGESGNVFESKQNTKVTVPMKRILQAERTNEASLGFEWVCLQVSFMKPNPAAGFEPDTAQQFFFQDQDIVQLGTIDSKGVRLLDKNDQTSVEGISLILQFEEPRTVDNFFFQNQTFCAQYNGNKPEDGKPWTDQKFDKDDQPAGATQDCQTIEEKENLDRITCQCQYVTNFYYTLVTDIDRDRLEKSDIQDETHFVLLAIGMPLLMVGLIMPCLMILLDAKDYQGVEDNIYPVDDYTIAKLEKARNALCKQHIYYNEKEISRYLELNDGDFRSGSFTVFMTFHRTLHPYFSLFSRFDYRMKRLTRFSFVLGQISLITVLLWLLYSQRFTKYITDKEEGLGFEEEDWLNYRWLYMSLLLSLFTIPSPDRCCCWFKTSMYLLNDESRHPIRPTENKLDEVASLADPGNTSQRTDIGSEAGLDDETEEFVRPALFDRFLQCKLVGLVLIYLFWIFALAMTAVLGVESGNDEDQVSFLASFVELTPQQANEFVMVWFMSIFVWGVLLNELRIVIISLLAPIQAQALFDRQSEIWALPKDQLDDAQKAYNNGFCTKVSCATISLIPPESVEIALDALYTIDIKVSAITRPDYYKVKYDQMEKFEGADKVYAKLMQETQVDGTSRSGIRGQQPVSNRGGDMEMATLRGKAKKGGGDGDNLELPNMISTLTGDGSKKKSKKNKTTKGGDKKTKGGSKSKDKKKKKKSKTKGEE